VERAIGSATRGLIEGDVAACERVITGDADLNAMQYELRDLCFTIILTQAPMARDLREVMGFHHMAAELERMGDHCVGIARIARDREDRPRLERADDILAMSELCMRQTDEMTDALMARDTGTARLIAGRDQAIDRLYGRIFDAMMSELLHARVDPVDATSAIFVAHHLERIGDRVTNLAEDLVYLETGAVEELG
jgi:phosphate transport system protein